MIAPTFAWPDPPLIDATAGVALRPWRVEDAPVLAAAWAEPDVAAQAAVPGAGASRDAARWIGGADARVAAGLSLDLAVAPVDALDEVWGEVGLALLVLRAGDRERREVEIGWWVLPAHRGRGIASSAAGLLLGWATSDLGLERVVARIGRENGASEAVAARIGLQRLGTADATRDLWAGPTPIP